MLYEFHRVQNKKKPGSLHATYLISGVRREEVASQSLAKKSINVDNLHQSISYLCSSSPPPEDTQKIPVTTISLVREEILDEERSKYESLSAIHIYSISQQALKDVQVLSDVSREVQEICVGKDQIETYSKYGSIKCKDVRRRTGVRMVASARDAPNKNTSSSVRTGSGENQTAITTKTKIEPTKPPTARDFFDRGQTQAKDVTSMAIPIKHSGLPSTNKIAADQEPPKSDSSAIFKAFSKSKPKIKAAGGHSSIVKIPSSGIIVDESSIDEMEISDDETKFSASLINQAVDKSQKSKKEREEALRKMMDDDDDDDDNDEVEKEEPISVVDIKNIEDSNSSEKIVKVKDEIPTTNNPRKRSRRRVMKKTTFKDEEGFLVTKEEPAWESFSEDEKAPALKPKSHPSAVSKSKRGVGGKPVQGNIMSFFGKK